MQVLSCARRRFGRGTGLLLLGAVMLTACSGGGSGDSRTPSGLTNQAPIAVLTPSVMTGVAPLQVSFDATASRDPDGRIVSFVFRPNGPDSAGSTHQAGSLGTHAYGAGEHTAVLDVTDDRGATTRTSVRIVVTSGPLGDLELHVSDTYGQPVPNLALEAVDSRRDPRFGVTDTDGVLLFRDLVAGPAQVVRVNEYGFPLFSADATVRAATVTRFDVRYEFPVGPGGLVRSVEATLIDAVTLELSAEVLLVEPDGRYLGSVQDLTIDVPAADLRLIYGVNEGNDAVQGFPATASDPQVEVAAGRADPADYHATVLADLADGSRALELHTRDLYALKELLRNSGAGNRFTLAAYAATGVAHAAKLPQLPVSFYPRFGGGYVDDGALLHPDLDDLRTLNGGTRPLFDAVDLALDHLGSITPAGLRRVLVVTANGGDAACPDSLLPTAACQQRLEASLSRATAIDADLYFVYRANPCCNLPFAARLNAAGRGGLIPYDELTMLRHLGAVLDDSAPRFKLRMRFTARNPGELREGRVLLGNLTAQGTIGNLSLPFVVVL